MIVCANPSAAVQRTCRQTPPSRSSSSTPSIRRRRRFADQLHRNIIEAVVDAGVCAYLVAKAERVKHILALCIFRFNAGGASAGCARARHGHPHDAQAPVIGGGRCAAAHHRHAREAQHGRLAHADHGRICSSEPDKMCEILGRAMEKLPAERELGPMRMPTCRSPGAHASGRAACTEDEANRAEVAAILTAPNHRRSAEGRQPHARPAHAGGTQAGARRSLPAAQRRRGKPCTPRG